MMQPLDSGDHKATQSVMGIGFLLEFLSHPLIFSPFQLSYDKEILFSHKF